MKHRGISISVESVLVMILLVIFAASMSILIVRGQESYSRLLDSKEQEENARIGLSYVNMMIRQNDRQGGFMYIEDAVEGIDAIFVDEKGDESGLGTYIFFYEGYLKACYTDEEPTIDLSEDVVPINNFESYLDEQMLVLEAEYIISEETMTMTKYISIQSMEVADYE